jgi:hypothetical protein
VQKFDLFLGQKAAVFPAFFRFVDEMTTLMTACENKKAATKSVSRFRRSPLFF